jgi:hypothetical protein
MLDFSLIGCPPLVKIFSEVLWKVDHPGIPASPSMLEML